MIEASFDAGRSRSASISGAYQYDTGQRIRMYGLPAPDELSQMDDFLSGDVVTVQAQYGYTGDSQSEPRLASYEEETGAWIAEVPDVYLTVSEPVYVYVYVMYGADEAHSRAKTLYRGSFTPISRPAPSDTVTPDQINAWDSLVAEVNLTLAAANTAASGANAAAASASTAAQQANSAAQAADTAAQAANAAGNAWASATTSATTLAAGSAATVKATDNDDGTKHLAFGIPRGAKGEKGDTGPAGVTFTLDGATLYIVTD